MKRSARPETVTVLGIPFTIKYLPNLKEDDGSDAYGLMDGPSRTISICSTKNSNVELIESSLVHEIIHAALYISGQTERLGDSEEGLVLALENAIAPLYKRNF